MFDRESAPHVAPFEICAGAFAVTDRRVAVGTYSGWAIFDVPTLGLLASQTHILPAEHGMIGVQWSGADLLMLAPPIALKQELWVLDSAHRAASIRALPAGNWRMTRHLEGEQLFLYDVTEGLGVACFDRGGQRWRVPMPDVWRVVAAAQRLLCLGRERLMVVDLSGQVLMTAALPKNFGWTSVVMMPDRTLVLGGYDKVSHDFVLAPLDRGGAMTGELSRHPLASVFSAKTIRAAFADQDCGIDLFHIGRMYSSAPGTLTMALGGGGDDLGACQGAAALAVVELGEHASWKARVVDTEDGISGFTPLPEGRWLADFCGELRVYK